MNTGIQDAVSLADRLAAVIHGQQLPADLDAYEAARRPVAQGVVRMTDMMTRLATATGLAPRLLRNSALRAIGRLPPVTQRIAARMAELTV